MVWLIYFTPLMGSLKKQRHNFTTSPETQMETANLACLRTTSLSAMGCLLAHELARGGAQSVTCANAESPVAK